MVTLLRKFIGDPGEKAVEKIRQQVVPQINALEPEMQALSDGELAGQTERFRERLAAGETLDDLLPEAFATVRETARRPEILGQRHYDVQLIGGVALHRGQIAEMKTGEGKTLVATLPVYLNALTGQGVHVVTVNDYLARRDTMWMGRIYRHLGLTVGCLQHDAAYQYHWDQTDDSNGMGSLKKVSRAKAYRCNVLYGTNSEFGFDYLRDNRFTPGLPGGLGTGFAPGEEGDEGQVQQKLCYAIVDEVDNILIDEARTPLIISGPAAEPTQDYYNYAKLARRLEDDDYTIDDRTQAVSLTQEGIGKMERWTRVNNLYDPENFERVHYIENALTAEIQKQRDKDYVVQDGEVIIIDEFTGRLQFGRRWSDGLHQAVEAKEGVRIQQESVTYATITLQNYFRLYDKLAGMTGTAATEADEFYKIYGLEVAVIPTNLEMVREDKPDQVFLNGEAKWRAAVEEIVSRYETGQPALVGTASVEASLDLSERLKKRGVLHQVLNAKNHAQEAGIIAQAGRLGAVTVSTNMAGRGTDIILGGNPTGRAPEDWQAEHDKVIDLGGLYVLGTEHHDARRIDNQLRGRSGRQGDPGSSQFYVSLEDELMQRFGGDRIKSVMNWSGMDEDTPIENKLISKSISGAQVKVEGYHFDIRKHLLNFDDVLNTQREVIYTDRKHILDERNSLRDRVVGMLRQTFDNLLDEYLPERADDDWDTAVGMLRQTFDNLLDEYLPERVDDDWDTETVTGFLSELARICPLTPELADPEQVDLWRREGKIRQVLADYAETVHAAKYKTFLAELEKVCAARTDLPKLGDPKQVDLWRREGKIRQVLADYAETVYTERERELGSEQMRTLERLLLLSAIDRHWVNHLTEMENLRTGVGLHAYGQRDPLVVYRTQGYQAFEELLKDFGENPAAEIMGLTGTFFTCLFDDKFVAELLDRLRRREFIYAMGRGLPVDPKQVEQHERLLRRRVPAAVSASPMQGVVGNGRSGVPAGTKIGRNAPCPCGSGRKYKRCCGANA